MWPIHIDQPMRIQEQIFDIFEFWGGERRVLRENEDGFLKVEM